MAKHLMAMLKNEQSWYIINLTKFPKICHVLNTPLRKHSVIPSKLVTHTKLYERKQFVNQPSGLLTF